MSRLASTWAAVRYRRSQSTPSCSSRRWSPPARSSRTLSVRTLEQGLLQAGLVERDPADPTVVVRAARTTADPATAPADLERLPPAAADRWVHAAIGMATADTRLIPEDGPARPRHYGSWRVTDVCDHVEVTTGRCPGPAGEALVSAADVTAWAWTTDRAVQGH